MIAVRIYQCVRNCAFALGAQHLARAALQKIAEEIVVNTVARMRVVFVQKITCARTEMDYISYLAQILPRERRNDVC